MGGATKPVKWTALASRLAQESSTRSDLRALHKDILGLAWNAAIWRFDDQRDLPIFTAERNWKKWIASSEGIAWQERWSAE